MKKLVSLFLALMLAFGIFSVSGITVSAASNMTLQQLQAKFPHGAYWNHYVNHTGEAADYLFSVGDNRFADSVSWQPCASHSSTDLNYYVGKYDCNVFNGGMQCFGFARKLGYDAFGTYPSSWGRATNLNSLKAGDIVRYMYDGHSIFVTGVNGDTVTYADCNYGHTCAIRWNQTTTKSAIASNGFNYVESAPSTLTVSTATPSVSIDINSWRYSIGEANAVVCANINNPNGGTIGTIGCYLYDANGEYIYCHSEEVNPSYKNATTVPMWTDFNVDAGYTLKMGTTYQYRLYAYIDGVEYCSELASFTTVGKTPPKNAVLTVEKETIRLGEKIVAHFSADHAEKYTVYFECFDKYFWVATSDVMQFQPLKTGIWKVYMVAENQDGSVTSNAVNVTVEPNQPMGSTTVTVGTKEQIPTELVRVPLLVDATVEIASYKGEVWYDSKALQLVDVEQGELNGSLQYSLLSDGRIEITYSGQTPYAKKGTLAELVFYVNKDAALGVSSITLSETQVCTQKDKWYDNNQLSVTLIDGGVTVVETKTPDVSDPSVTKGDVNVDTKINAKDALEVLKATVGKVNLTQEQQTAADVNKDGKVDAKDALEILKYTVGKPSALDNQ